MDPHLKVVPLHLHPLGFIEGFTSHGAPLDALLHGTGISREMLVRRDVKISYAQQKALIANGVRLCSKPGIGLLVGSTFDWSYYGTVGGIVHCAPSLHAAGEAFRRYVMIAQPYYAALPRQPGAYVDAHGLIVEPFESFPDRQCPDPRLRQFEMEFRLSIMLRLWDACGNKTVADASVHVCLDYSEPTHAALYRSLLPLTSIRFGAAQSSVAASKDFCLTPFRPLRRAVFESLLDQCERELRRANVERSYSARVRWHLMSRLDEPLTLERIAAMLGLTERTLTRRLAEESTTFRAIVRDVRMEQTAYYLRKSRLSVDEIAELMGFSCASSLRRALRSWSGDAVSAVRNTQAHASPATVSAGVMDHVA